MLLVLVTVLLLLRDTTAKATLVKKRLNWELAYSFRELVMIIMVERRQAWYLRAFRSDPQATDREERLGPA